MVVGFEAELQLEDAARCDLWRQHGLDAVAHEPRSDPLRFGRRTPHTLDLSLGGHDFPGLPLGRVDPVARDVPVLLVVALALLRLGRERYQQRRADEEEADPDPKFPVGIVPVI